MLRLAPQTQTHTHSHSRTLEPTHTRSGPVPAALPPLSPRSLFPLRVFVFFFPLFNSQFSWAGLPGSLAPGKAGTSPGRIFPELLCLLGPVGANAGLALPSRLFRGAEARASGAASRALDPWGRGCRLGSGRCLHRAPCAPCAAPRRAAGPERGLSTGPALLLGGRKFTWC